MSLSEDYSEPARWPLPPPSQISWPAALTAPLVSTHDAPTGEVDPFRTWPPGSLPRR